MLNYIQKVKFRYLVILTILNILIIGSLHHLTSAYAFQLNKDHSVPEFIEFFMLLACAAVLYFTYYKHMPKVIYVILSIIFIYLAFDNLLRFHEHGGLFFLNFDVVNNFADKHSIEAYNIGEFIYLFLSSIIGGIVIGIALWKSTLSSTEKYFIAFILIGFWGLFGFGVIFDTLQKFQFVIDIIKGNGDFIEEISEFIAINYLLLIILYFTKNL